MRTFALAFSTLAMIAAGTAAPALADSRDTSPPEVRGDKGDYRDGYTRCRRSAGTTGLIAGGVGGAVVGNKVLGHGLLGTAAGAAGGALAGRAIDRTITAKKRCRY